MALMNEAKQYFKSAPELVQLIEALAKRYQQYGEFKGSLAKATFANPEPLLGLLGISIAQWQRSKRLAVSDVLAAYADSAFASLPLTEVVAQVLGKPLMTKAEQAVQEQARWSQFETRMQQEAPQVWALLDDQQRRRYCREQQGALTGDPHALDQSTALGRLLTILLSHQQQRSVTDAQSRFELYLTANLVPDSVLNFATVQNLTAADPLFEAAAASQVIWNVPMMTILPIERIEPISGKHVFLVENSGVFAILANRFPKLPMVMTSGQYSAAIWSLLDRLQETCTIYYASDMDPAGMGMAAKLWARYPKQVRFYGMSVAAFRLAESTSPITEPEQLSQLSNLTVPPLEELRRWMLRKREKVYQEGIVGELLREISLLSDVSI